MKGRGPTGAKTGGPPIIPGEHPCGPQVSPALLCGGMHAWKITAGNSARYNRSASLRMREVSTIPDRETTLGTERNPFVPTGGRSAAISDPRSQKKGKSTSQGLCTNYKNCSGNYKEASWAWFKVRDVRVRGDLVVRRTVRSPKRKRGNEFTLACALGWDRRTVTRV